jgi:ATP-dependent RNA helicase RhlE
VCVDEHEYLRDIEKLIKRAIPKDVIAGFEPDPHAKAQPILQRQGRGGGQGRAPQSRFDSKPGQKRPAGKAPQARTPEGSKHRPGAAATPRSAQRPPTTGSAPSAKARPPASGGAASAASPAASPRSRLAAQHRPVNRGR